MTSFEKRCEREDEEDRLRLALATLVLPRNSAHASNAPWRKTERTYREEEK